MRLLIAILTLFIVESSMLSLQAADRPNVLWLTSEDNGIELGCYGDDYADTPNIDGLAKVGLKYNYCWSNAPVCAPARTTIISGMYPPSLGAQHMRSHLPMPEGIRMYPQYLREAGYYCTNHTKEDYNLEKPGEVWDESGKKAHWKNRQKDQPFFAIFNFTVSHESKLRTRPHEAVHDPAGVKLPAYHPDIKESRQDWAQYYDRLTEMDAEVGERLDELKKAGLMDETIIFYYGDHGSGMPRHKRWPYDSGLRVPLIVHIPKKFQHLAPPEYSVGGSSDRLVSFVDLAPTLLSLCGVELPDHFQGKAFAGPDVTKKPEYIYGFRGRMDERPDFVRCLRNERFIYIRQFNPHRPYGQFLHYMFQTPTTRKWYELHLAGKLTPEQDMFWQEKPYEELYDLEADPDEVNNLAVDPAYETTANQMRKALWQHMTSTNDLGAIPEAELHQRCGETSPYDLQQQGKLTEDLDKLTLAAAVATQTSTENVSPEDIEKAFSDDESVIRYWACIWALNNKEQGVQKAHDHLQTCLQDDSSSVRVAAAEALGRFGNQDDLNQALPVLLAAADLETSDVYTAIAALNSIDYLDNKAASVREQIAELPKKVKGLPPRTDSYVPRLLEKILADLDGKELP